MFLLKIVGEESLRFLVLTTIQNKPRVDKDLVYSDYFDVKDLNVDSSKNFKVKNRFINMAKIVFLCLKILKREF
jgi:hypothetical protein